MLDAVRKPLLDEAKASPNLLADLAGLEQYVAESYQARSIVELLQNADDAGAKRFRVERCAEYLIVANDGRTFTERDFESLCRSAASTKQRGETIGYRGIGFKSVVGLATSVYVFSGDLRAAFSRERTMHEVPGAQRVPLVRIPHPLDAADRAALEPSLQPLIQDKFTTVFIFGGLLPHSVEEEVRHLDPTCLLFLRNVENVEVRAKTSVAITAKRREAGANRTRIDLTSSAGTNRWLLFERDEVCFAFAENESGVIRPSDDLAVVHAFLPTHEATGVGIKIHADFSTDPSRTRVVFDGRTKEYVHRAAARLVESIAAIVADHNPTEVKVRGLTVLVPRTDPRILSFQRPSFESELVAQMVHCGTSKLGSLRLRPEWLKSGADFEGLAQRNGMAFLARRFEEIAGLVPFLRACGAREASIDELAESFHKHDLSILAAAEILDHVSTLNATGQFPTTAFDAGWKLWSVDGGLKSLRDVAESDRPLDMRFLDLIREKSGTLSNVGRLTSALIGAKAAQTLMPGNSGTSASQQPDRAADSQQPKTPTVTLKKWRSAEQQVESILSSLGWVVRDVSKQNVGYDLEGRTNDAEDVFVEVKSVNRAGEPFTMTSNEEAVARQKGDNYAVAVVWQEGDELCTALIRNPIAQMQMTRQCRQWVWLCEGYPIQPLRFLVS